MFTGFQNQSQLGVFYSADDYLVLPSSWSETWGLVANETLQCRMPAVDSDRVVCARDLVIPGKTGYVFPAGEAAAMAGCMSRAIRLIKLRGIASGKLAAKGPGDIPWSRRSQETSNPCLEL